MRDRNQIDEMSNVRELGEFRGYWSKSEDYPDENFGNIVVYIPVDIEYDWNNGRKNTSFSSILRAFVGSGPEDGKIDIDETDRISVEKFHLQFKPAFQTYEYDERDHSLVVTGLSSKMGGRYEVRMTPTISDPKEA